MFFMMDWRFREVMSEAGLTQEKMAELLNCSKGQVSMLLSGERKFHSDWIEKISHALNIPTWYLFLDPSELPEKEERRFFEKYSKAPEHVQKTIKILLDLEDY